MRTLLQLTQSILNDADGDEVNSISDTIEAEQAAQLLIDTYLEMVSELDLPSRLLTMSWRLIGLSTTRLTY